MRRSSIVTVFGLLVAASAASAQRPGGATPVQTIIPQGTPIAPAPAYVRTTPPTDPVIQRMWEEGMQRSQAMALAQELTDVVGPRLTASPAATTASDWAMGKYQSWGVTTRRENYGTWNSWRRGVSHLDLLAPRVRSLEAIQLAWSPGTNGKAVEGDVIGIPELADSNAANAWVKGTKGKFVLTGAAQPSCRQASQLSEFATTETQGRIARTRDSLQRTWRDRLGMFNGQLQAKLAVAGALGALASNWSNYPGIDKIFGSWRQAVPTIDVGCEDFGLLSRLAANGQGPKVRYSAESQFLGEQPVFNTIAEIRGSEKPDEYIVLSAHFDSWDGSSGATDNGTGTITMMEAMRILKTVYPNPKRTILAGHWQGEEQGLNGSRAFSEDHPEIVNGLHALFNQDNGTGRVVVTGPGALPGAGPRLEEYLWQLPSQITGVIRMAPPGAPASGGSDNASFACHGAPAFGIGALGWDYGSTTWHTNRDTFDKIVAEDLMNNATLTAMLAYQAAEDPQKMPRDRLDPLPIDRSTGQPMVWQPCPKATRKTVDSAR